MDSSVLKCGGSNRDNVNGDDFEGRKYNDIYEEETRN